MCRLGAMKIASVFTANFIRITLPINPLFLSQLGAENVHEHASEHASDHASDKVKKLLVSLDGDLDCSQLQDLLGTSDYQTARKYWKVLKGRILTEAGQPVIICYQFKLRAADGKMRMSDVADLWAVDRCAVDRAEPCRSPYGCRSLRCRSRI